MSLKAIASLILLGFVLLSVYNLTETPQSSTLLAEYNQWKIDFNINYDSEFEDLYRLKLFAQKKILIELHNRNSSKSYTRGINQFSALTQEEFSQTYLTYQRDYIPAVKKIDESSMV